jgi:hypothetical protein
MLMAFDVLSIAEAPRAASRFWIGEVIGVTVLTSVFLVASTRGWAFKFSWELAGLVIVTLSALGAVFAFSDVYRFQVFYVLFLPLGGAVAAGPLAARAAGSACGRIPQSPITRGI